MALTRTPYALHVFTQLRSDIYLGIALTSTPHRPGTHHADAQSAEGDVDVRSLPGHYEEADSRDAESRCDQPVPVRFPFHHLCSLPPLLCSSVSGLEGEGEGGGSAQGSTLLIITAQVK